MAKKSISYTPCHCFKLRLSAENVINFYDEKLMPAGVTSRQLTILDSLYRLKECSARELAEEAQLESSSLARSLKPLRNRGLIEDLRERGTRDSRLTLTEEGNRIYHEAVSLWEQAQKQFEEHLGTQKVRELEEALLLTQSL